MVEEERDAQDARPRRRAGVELRVVASPREGDRHVLADEPRGVFLELRGGERDVFIWDRLDGTRSLREIALEFVDNYGALPRDLAGLIGRLALSGYLEDGFTGEPESRPRTSTADRLRWRFAFGGATSLANAAGGALGFVASPLALAVLLAVGLVGAALAARSLGTLRGTLLELGGSPWLGLVALLATNALLSLLESVARAAALRRGGTGTRRAGISLDAGVPGTWVDASGELLLPLEKRVAVDLAPLATALAFAGGAVMGLLVARAHAADPHAPLLEVLAKVAWIGFLRALAHGNPLGPSGLQRAFGAWFGIPDVRAAARRFFTHDVWTHMGAGSHEAGREAPGLSRRDHVLLVHGALSLAWLVLVARTLAHLALGELVPHLTALLNAHDPVAAGALLVPLAVTCVPLVAVSVALVLSFARNAARAARTSPLLATPRGAGSLVALVAAVAAARAATLPPAEAAAVAATAGIVAALLGFLFAPGEDGRGRAARACTIFAVAVTIETFAAALLADALAHGACPEALERGVAWMHLAALLVLVAGALVELASSARAGAPAAFLAPVVGVAAVAALAVPALSWHAELQARVAHVHLPPALAPGLAGAAALLLGGAALASFRSLRAPSRGWLAAAALALGAARALELLPIHLPARLAPESVEAALTALGLGFAAAAFHARGREGAARAFPGAPVFGAGDREGSAVLGAALAELPRFARDHLGVGASDIVATRIAAEKGDGARLARTALAVARSVAGERWLARALGASLARVPAPERERVAAALANVPALAPVAQDLRFGARPDAKARFELFRAVPILGPAADEDVRALSLLAVHEIVPFGRAVVREGDEGDRFYVIVQGDAQVSVHGKDGFERTVANLRAGDAFGEAALLRHEPRAATVTATSPSLELLSVERDAFLAFARARKQLLQRILDRVEDTWLVRSIAIFSELDGAQVNALFHRFVEIRCAAGVDIVREGDAGDRFYVVREGEMVVTVDEAGGGRRPIATLGRGDYFGEMALLHEAPRAATVTAVVDSELLALDRDDFLRTLSARARTSLDAETQRRAKALGGGS